MNNVILVTGAAGFIGSHLCEELISLGYPVLGIDNFDVFYQKEYKKRNISSLLNSPLFRFIEGDFGNWDDLDRFQTTPDIVIHLAAKAGVLPSLKSPAEYIYTNIHLTNNLLEWMRQKGVKKMLFASSSSVYGNTKEIPFKESQNVDMPFSPYAFTKRSCELMNYTYHDLYNMDILNLRFFTVYGERQRPDLAIHKFVDKIINDKPITLYGNGGSSRDYTYWRDTINGVLAALDYLKTNNKLYDTFNLGNNKPIKLIELVECISEAVGIKPIILFEEMKPGDVDITFAETTKAFNILGYQATTTLEVGINKFIKWYREVLTQ